MTHLAQEEALVRGSRLSVARRVRRPVRIAGKAVPDSECELVGIDAGVLFLHSERRIADTSAVTISFDRTQLSGYVSGCQPVETGWAVSISLVSGRRKEVRIPTGEHLAVGVVSSSGTKRYHCTVVDRSASGLGLRFARHIAPGTRIYVEIESSMVMGEIRYCNPVDDGHYLAGMAVVECVQDMRERNVFSEIAHKLRWKLSAGIRGQGL